MTVTIYDHSAHPSTVYTATCNGVALSLCGRSTDTQFNTPFWSAGATVPQSWATIATDETVAIVVSMVSGSVTSAKVYANAAASAVIAHTIVAGTLRFSLPPNTVAWCEINGSRGTPLILHSKPLTTQPTGGTVDVYNGTQTKAVTGRTLVFPAGTHTIGQSFEVEADAKVWMHGGAWVIGSLWLSSESGGNQIYGHGVLSGEWGAASRASIRTGTPFDTWLTYAMIRGAFVPTNPSSCSGITIVDPPAYNTWEGISGYEDVTLIGPWWANSDGFLTADVDATTGGTTVNRCCAFIHDDVLSLDEPQRNHIATNVICGSIGSAAVKIGYHPFADQNASSSVTNLTIVCLNTAIPNGSGSHFLGWADGSDPALVLKGLTFRNIRFMGSLIAGRPFDLQNKVYPFLEAEAELGMGQIQDIVFEDVTLETVPTIKSELTGRDWLNGPSRIHFNNVRYAGTLLTTLNFLDYFNVNPYIFDIFVGGKPLVTSVAICNRALDLIGHQKRITDISGADGSAEAMTCAEHYTTAVNELLEMREWNFATVKRELVALAASDDPAYDYAYEVPEGMLKAIALLEDGASDNYLRNGFEVAPQNYEMHADEEDVVRIYSDTAGAWLRFTKYVTNPNYFTPQFLNALYWLLASKIAGPIIKGAEGGRERDRCLQMFALALGEAAKVDAVQQKRPTETPIATWQRRGRIQ